MRHVDGMTTFEALFTLLFITVVGLGLTRSTVVAIQTANKNVHNSIAQQIAMDTIETYSTISPDTLDDTDDSVSTVVVEGYSFTVTINITINSSRSRTVNVNVRSNSDVILTNVTVADSFSLWGTR